MVKSCKIALILCGALLAGAFAAALASGQAPAPAPHMTGRYHFLGPEDVLSILQEEDLIKGYIDVYDSDSDDVLSYQITIGSRKGDQVDFRTRAIHEKFFRFSGTVERGTGKKAGDTDYLELRGTLQTITLNSVTGEQKDVRQQVVLKSIPPGEGPPD